MIDVHAGAVADRLRRPVLIVDDDKDIRETLQEIVEDEGYAVATARDGVEALERVRAVRPGLVILDLFMPGMDGAEFRRRQLSDPSIAGVPVIVVSAAAGVEDRIAGMRPAGHLEKPIRLEQLLGLIASHCG